MNVPIVVRCEFKKLFYVKRTNKLVLPTPLLPIISNLTK